MRRGCSREHAEHDGKREPGDDALAHAEEGEGEDEGAGHEARADHLGVGVVPGEGAHVDETGNGPGDGNRLAID